ncbi:hypothetical protein [Nocardiopsis sp. CC223A]|uniref:hypothetical protein n=1 Tax=Nocardiopsis sp. CC223A TaxID=3044051 RepID=UPI00278C81E5|nr:hypothetical protein [Nocardiopsis sp. CC223A]
MTSASALPSSAVSAETLAALDREIRRALVARATDEEELRLQDGRRIRGGDGPHEYVFTCHHWPDSPEAPGSAGFLVRPPSATGPWHPAEAAPALGGRVHVTTTADLGPQPGDLLLRDAAVPSPGAPAERIEMAALQRRFGALVPPETLAERICEGMRARIEELTALLAAARGQDAARDRLARAQVAVDRARFREERVSAEVALREAEARRARRSLERVERGLRSMRAPSGPFAARRAARIGRSAARARELRSMLVTALREHEAAAERLVEASGAMAFRVRERDRALEATRGLPAAGVLAERIARVEHELRCMRLMEAPPVPPRPRPPLEDVPRRPAVPEPGVPLEEYASAAAPHPAPESHATGRPSRPGCVPPMVGEDPAAAA